MAVWVSRPRSTTQSITFSTLDEPCHASTTEHKTVSLTYSSESFLLLIALPRFTVSIIMCAFDIIVWQCVPAVKNETHRWLRGHSDRCDKQLWSQPWCRGCFSKLQMGVFHSVWSVRIERIEYSSEGSGEACANWNLIDGLMVRLT